MASVHNSYELFLATTLSFDVDKTDATKVASFNRNSNGFIPSSFLGLS